MSWIASLKHHSIEIWGGACGTISGVVGMIKGFIIIRDDLHALLIALLTGAAGTLGALIIRLIWDSIFKRNNPDDDGSM